MKTNFLILAMYTPIPLIAGLILFGSFSFGAGDFPGYYRIINVNSGKLLEAKNDADVFEIQQMGYLGGENQEWELILVEDGFYKIVNREFGTALDLVGGSRESGGRISLYEYLGGDNQKWELREIGPDVYGIGSKESGKFLDVPNFSREDEVTVKQWGFHGDVNQQWRLEPIRGRFQGTYFIQNDFIKVGIDGNSGGSITWISEVESERNIVNVHDRGRYIQQSYYAGDKLNRQDEGQSRFWSPFPWNAIQGGDYFENKPIVMELEISEEGEEVYVKTRPLLWDMNGDYAQCYMETWITLEEKEIIYRGRLTRFVVNDRWGVRNSFQELPAIYLDKSLNHFYSYTGDDVWTGKINEIPSSNVWEDWVTHESWIALVDLSNWGFSVYFPGVSTFSGGFYAQGEGDDPTAYVSPRLDVEIGQQDTYEFVCYFQLGYLAEMQNRIYVRRHLNELRALGVIE